MEKTDLDVIIGAVLTIGSIVVIATYGNTGFGHIVTLVWAIIGILKFFQMAVDRHT